MALIQLSYKKHTREVSNKKQRIVESVDWFVTEFLCGQSLIHVLLLPMELWRCSHPAVCSKGGDRLDTQLHRTNPMYSMPREVAEVVEFLFTICLMSVFNWSCHHFAVNDQQVQLKKDLQHPTKRSKHAWSRVGSEHLQSWSQEEGHDHDLLLGINDKGRYRNISQAQDISEHNGDQFLNLFNMFQSSSLSSSGINTNMPSQVQGQFSSSPILHPWSDHRRSPGTLAVWKCW